MPLHFPQDTPPSIFSHLHRPPPSLHSRNSNLYPLYPMYLSLLIKFPLRHAQSHNVLFVHSILFVYSKYGTTVREIPYTDMILFRRTPLAVSQSTHGFFFSIHIFFKFCGPICLIFLIKNQKKMVHKRKNLSKPDVRSPPPPLWNSDQNSFENDAFSTKSNNPLRL